MVDVHNIWWTLPTAYKYICQNRHYFVETEVCQRVLELNECFLISFGKTFLFVTNCREFMINFMCFLFEGGGAVENSFSLFCSSSLTREHTFFVCFVFAVLLHFIIHKELMMDKHMQTSYILWIVFFTCIIRVCVTGHCCTCNAILVLLVSPLHDWGSNGVMFTVYWRIILYMLEGEGRQ